MVSFSSYNLCCFCLTKTFFLKLREGLVTALSIENHNFVLYMAIHITYNVPQSSTTTHLHKNQLRSVSSLKSQGCNSVFLPELNKPLNCLCNLVMSSVLTLFTLTYLQTMNRYYLYINNCLNPNLGRIASDKYSWNCFSIKI